MTTTEPTALLDSLLRPWWVQGQRLLFFNRLMAFALAGTALWIVQPLFIQA